MLWDIFKDDNEFNEKTIIGFMSFAVMVLTSFVDVGTGLLGMDFEIHEYIYNSFVVVTLGSFGIAGLDRFSPAAKVEAAADVGYSSHKTDSYNNYSTDYPSDTRGCDCTCRTPM